MSYSSNDMYVSPYVSTDKTFSPTSQPVVIYDTEKLYKKNSSGKLVSTSVVRRVIFDGVTKLEHKLSLTVEADPTNAKGAKYVNGAINNQNEISMDLYMSNVYTSPNIYYYASSSETEYYNPDSDEIKKNSIANTSDRSGNLFAYLNNLKKSRRKVSVITPYVTYSNMLLSEIGIIQDDSVYNGWYGSLTFKESITSKGTGGSSSYSKTNSVESAGRTASMLVSVLGSHV